MKLIEIVSKEEATVEAQKILRELMIELSTVVDGKWDEITGWRDSHAKLPAYKLKTKNVKMVIRPFWTNDEFYNITTSLSVTPESQEAKDGLWRRVRDVVKKVAPGFVDTKQNKNGMYDWDIEIAN